jgi:type I restriction enzyme S subunit
MPLIEEYGKKETELKALNEQIGALTKKAILQEAVQGKLVPQIAAEGNAKDLLEEIQKEKAKLIKEGKIKKEKPLPEITEDEIPFDIPENWCWCRLKSVADVFYGFPLDASKFNNDNNGKMIVRIRDIKPAISNTFTTEEIPQEYSLHKNDMLVGMDGNFNVNFWPIEGALLNQRVCKITTNPNFYEQKFLFYILPMFLDEISENVSYCTVKHLSDKHLSTMYLPLPPLAEQKRIVAAIEKLLLLCEKLGE